MNFSNRSKSIIIKYLPLLFAFYNLVIRHKVFIPQKSYADSGEDLFILKHFKRKKGFYVDVGCHHPTRINNCHLLYKKGWSGINIDINHISIRLFNIMRRKDININSAVSLKEKNVKFFYDKLLSPYNSLVKQKDLKNSHYVKSETLSNIIDKTKYKNKFIDFLSVDVEGKDLEVLKSLDFKRYKPKFICVEIWGVSKNKNFKLIKSPIYKFLINKKYTLVFNKRENYIFKKKGASF